MPLLDSRYHSYNGECLFHNKSDHWKCIYAKNRPPISNWDLESSALQSLGDSLSSLSFGHNLFNGKHTPLLWVHIQVIFSSCLHMLLCCWIRLHFQLPIPFLLVTLLLFWWSKVESSTIYFKLTADSDHCWYPQPTMCLLDLVCLQVQLVTI